MKIPYLYFISIILFYYYFIYALFVLFIDTDW